MPQTYLLLLIFGLFELQTLPRLRAELGGPTIIDEKRVQEFKEANKDLGEEILEEELMFNFYYPMDCDCWGDGFYNCVMKWKMDASSSLTSIGTNTYGPENLNDYDLRTAWVEGKEGYGIGERIKIELATIESPGVQTTHLVIVNGYVKNLNLWRANSRVKTMKLFIDGQATATLHLEDTHFYQRFNVSDFLEGKSKAEIELEILNTYPGSKYKDTAISEVVVKGVGCM